MMGVCVRDPELRRTGSGVACANVRICVERNYANKGEGRKCDYFDVVAWRSKGEFLSKYFKKGKSIIVQGSLENREWTDRDGNKRTSTEIIVGENGGIYFAGGNKGEQGDKPAGAASKPAASGAKLPWEQGDGDGDYAMMDDEEENLPF
jgi:single-strand DNA-binding protein